MDKSKGRGRILAVLALLLLAMLVAACGDSEPADTEGCVGGYSEEAGCIGGVVGQEEGGGHGEASEHAEEGEEAHAEGEDEHAEGDEAHTEGTEEAHAEGEGDHAEAVETAEAVELAAAPTEEVAAPTEAPVEAGETTEAAAAEPTAEPVAPATAEAEGTGAVQTLPLQNPLDIPTPTSVTVAGSLQDEVGCPGEWQPECQSAMLTYDPDADLWTGTFDLPAGSYDYKAALNGTWDIAFGANADGTPGSSNIALALEADSSVLFVYDHQTGLIADNVNNAVAVLAGDFQDEVGCPDDWSPDCLRTWLQDLEGDGIYAFSTARIPAGDWQVKVAHNLSWDESYGVDGDGTSGSANIPFTVTQENALVTFNYDPATHLLTITEGEVVEPEVDNAPAASAIPDAGSAEATAEAVAVAVATEAVEVAAAPTEEVAPAATEAPVEAVATAEAAVSEATAEPEAVVTAEAETTTTEGTLQTIPLRNPLDVPTPNSVTIAGTVQDELGCPGEWQPECQATMLTYDPNADLWAGTFNLPAGSYEYKAALNGNWTVSFGVNADGTEGSANIPLTLEADSSVLFIYDHQTGWVADNVNNIVAVLAGDFQQELGCAGDWAPDCLRSWLQDPDGDGIYAFSTAKIPVGDWQVKVAHNQSWDESYGVDGDGEGGSANIPFTVTQENALVTFNYDPTTHLLTISEGEVVEPEEEIPPTAPVGPSAGEAQATPAPAEVIVEPTPIPVPEVDAREGSLLAALNNNRGTTLLVTLLSSSGLAETLNGEDPYTVFAPINLVFDSLPAGALDALMADQTVLATIVGNHIVPGTFRLADLTDGQTLTTINGTELTVHVEDGKVRINDAVVMISDEEADNGVFHTINQVLLPPDFELPAAPEQDTTSDATPVPAAGGEVDPATVQGLFNPNGFANPATVTVAGTLQDEAGCDNEWAPECEATMLSYDAGWDIWAGSFALPAGTYEYKAALNGNWDQNYGRYAVEHGENVPLTLEADATVTFYYDHKTGWITDNINSIIATTPGSYQGEMGCPAVANDGDWEPGCLRTWLRDLDGDGIYTFQTPRIPAGDYEVKVAIDGSWTENYGVDGAAGGANIPFNVPADRTLMTFTWDSTSKILTVEVGGTVPLTDQESAAWEGGPQAAGNIDRQSAYWVSTDTLAWSVAPAEGMTYRLHYSSTAELALTPEGVTGGESIELTVDEAGLPEAVTEKFPHLAALTALKIGEADLEKVPDWLRGQLAISVTDADGVLVDATGLQIPGVLDDLYTYDGDLGIIWEGDVPTLAVWAPTAQNVRLFVFDDGDPATEGTAVDMTRDDATGVWSAAGEADWNRKYYAYEVTVFHPASGNIETYLVTDPYSVSLSMNSQRSQIVNLNDPDLLPEGWAELEKPELNTFEDIVLYELHIRDFSVTDQSVPEEIRGTYVAFTQAESAGMTHLSNLADAGLTHIHLLPIFDIATINENAAERTEPDMEQLATFDPASEEQQALINPLRDQDAFNWGYDPYHYSVPEGSYSTDPNGIQRIIEFRQMVQALNQAGLRVVMDVVYNHTNSSGMADRSVLDKIVPGYYHRLNDRGAVEASTCCANTATEHNMMRKLMVDSVRLWATAYKVDGFRFDLMGHHMLQDMIEVREMLDSLTVEADGVDGGKVYIYGEGWNFGEVENNQRGTNATQLNIGGTGIGVFNDRIRDAIRGGNPFGDYQVQGFTTGLYYDPNGVTPGTEEEQLARLLLLTDHIRIGMAGNLADYQIVNSEGETVTGAEVLYNGSPTGYTQDPQENIVYAEAHDNETFFDIMTYKTPVETSIEDRVRIQNLANAIVMFSQGVPFYHAGQDMLRSKSFDKNSYNSGDWYNRLDWTYESNNFGIGLPNSGDNGAQWEIQRPLLENPDVAPRPEDIQFAVSYMLDLLQIRMSSPLFRLETGEAVMERLHFYNEGPDQIPGVIVMHLSDETGDDLDPTYTQIVVIVNASDEEQTFAHEDFAGDAFELHPIQVSGSDEIVKNAAFDADGGSFTVPARTTAVFVVSQGE